MGALSAPSYSDFQGKLTIKYNCKSTTTIIIIILYKKIQDTILRI